MLGLLAVLAPHVHQVALGHHRRERLGDRLIEAHAAVRRGRQRHVVGSVNGDPVVEVDRVHHPAQRAGALAVVPTGEPEHAARRLGVGALLLGHRLRQRFAVGAGVVRQRVAPLLGRAVGILLARRDVRDQLRRIIFEHDQHCLRHIDLDMRGTGPGRAARRNGDSVLHRLPHLVADPTLGIGSRGLQDQLLVRPHCLLRSRPEQAIDGAGSETEVGQPLLHLLDIFTSIALADGLADVGLDDCRISIDHDRKCRDARRRRRGRPDDGGCNGVGAAGAAPTRHPGDDHHGEHAGTGDHGHPATDGRGRAATTAARWWLGWSTGIQNETNSDWGRRSQSISRPVAAQSGNGHTSSW